MCCRNLIFTGVTLLRLTKFKMERYVKLDPIEHVLKRPDTYCGSLHPRPQEEYVFEEGRLFKRQVQYSPALVRCFLEILSNATDNATRDTRDLKQTKIVVDIIDTKITVLNDGAVIPVEINKREGMYNHSLIFGTLLTGSNYDDKEERTTVGRNGIGAKLTNIFSKSFTVEGVDPERGLKLTQTWTRNMRKTEGPTVCKSRGKGYTKISFDLELSRFGVKELPVALFSRFVLDAAMTTGLKVVLNGQKMPTKLDSYLALIDETQHVCKAISGGSTSVWVSPADKSVGFEHISFVNGLRTRDGGKHVDAAVEAVCRPIVTKLKVTLREIKPLFRFLVVSTVVNPEFNGQEKNFLEAPVVKLDPIPAAVVNKLLKFTDSEGRLFSSIIKSQIEDKEKKVLAKSVSTKSLAIEGYDRANYSGTTKSKECILILCEGLSAKTFAVAGIEKGMYGKTGRNYFGIYPLRGKLLNTRNASITTISRNTVITNLVGILGLDFSKPNNTAKLSYGKLCMLTDADVDGIHIEGLVLNFLHSMFPSLLDRGFVISMKTPIFKTIVGRRETFYYDEKSLRQTDLKRAKIKYYKGLGTTKPEDVKQIFGEKILEFTVDEHTDESFETAFNKGKTFERKQWIEQFDPSSNKKTLDDDKETIIECSVTKHLNEELVKFFHDDCSRTLPSVFDGLKESQRKVLFAAKKRNLVTDLKVAQFGAYVAEHTGYHHGEANLFGTIIKMAQSYPGSNNMPLLAAEGMFGTRLSGGEDAASPRYIYTKMTKACATLFPDVDVYEPLMKEGAVVEPEYYVPILPTLLINGCVGIASGWMCSCPSFNPEDVLENSRRAIRGENLVDIKPWFRGFCGSVVDVGNGKYETKGVYSIKSKKITITELPIGMWNDKFKLACEEDASITTIKDLSTPDTPHYTLTVDEEKFDIDAFEKRMLTTTLNTNNIVVFDKSKKITRVSVDDVFTIWAEERLFQNNLRKTRLLTELKQEESALVERIKFIRLVREKVLILTAQEESIIKTMRAHGIENIKLLDLSMRQLTEDKRIDCERTLMKIREKRKILESTSPEEMWESDVGLLVAENEINASNC